MVHTTRPKGQLMTLKSWAGVQTVREQRVRNLRGRGGHGDPPETKVTSVKLASVVGRFFLFVQRSGISLLPWRRFGFRSGFRNTV